jgi:flagellar P-ring protein precursor FlgI
VVVVMVLSLDKALRITSRPFELRTARAQLLAMNMADASYTTIGIGSARPLDTTSVLAQAPQDTAQRIPFVSVLESFSLPPGDAPAKSVITSRTGTVVAGAPVRITAAPVSHGNSTVPISGRPKISQPVPLSGGNTAVVPSSDVKVTQETDHMFLFPTGGEPGQDRACRQSAGRGARRSGRDS